MNNPSKKTSKFVMDDKMIITSTSLLAIIAYLYKDQMLFYLNISRKVCIKLLLVTLIILAIRIYFEVKKESKPKGIMFDD